MKSKRKFLIGALCAAALLTALAGGLYLRQVADYKRQVAAIQITEVDLAAVEDGEYIGECDVGMVAAKVKVTVEAHEIIAVELLEHQNGRGVPAEVITAEIVRRQKVDVDAVSGATNSSQVIKKAVENALGQTNAVKYEEEAQ